MATPTQTHPSFLTRIAGTQIVRFGTVSTVATVVDLTTFWVLHHALPSTPYTLSIAATAGYLLGTWLNFEISRRWVFRPTDHPVAREALLVLIVSLIGLALTVALTNALALGAHLHAMVARIIALITVFFWNYLGRRWFVYGAS